MTNPSAKPTFLSKGFDRTMIEGAASSEAVRAGHPEVDFEQLLLGLLVCGGPAARRLMDAGVDLAAARVAIDELHREDLALLGVRIPLPVPDPAAAASAAGMQRLTPRLRELVDECPTAGGDRALLAALIDDEGGRVRRVLDRVGADTDRIRADMDAALDGENGADASAGGATARSGSAEGGWQYATYDIELPVAAELVWNLVSDPARHGEWEPSAVSSQVTADGSVEMTDREGATTRTWIAQAVPGREVTWEKEPPASGIPASTLRVAVEPLGDRSRLHLRTEVRSALGDGVRGRIGNRMVRWIIRNQLRMRAQAIAQSAA
ncbi:SRPBCC family protein [Nocardiopsis coralliicola]